MIDVQQLLAGWPRGRWGIAAAVGVTATFFLTALDTLQHYHFGFLILPVLLGLARAFALAAVFYQPQVALGVSLAATAVMAPLSAPNSSGEPWPWTATAVFSYSIVLALAGAQGMPRRELLNWWLAAQAFSVVTVIAAVVLGFNVGWSTLVVMALLSAVGAGVGDVLRSATETRSQLAVQETITEAERSERSRLQERARIARELHDVVAHHLSVVVVRADSAPHRLSGLPDAVRAEFAEIAEAARSSLAEMRRVLRILREEQPDAELEPQPGLDQLPELIAAHREAGAAIEVDAETVADVDPAVQLTAYRVVQEALSNAVRHATGAPIEVEIRRTASMLVVRVRNGRGTTATVEGTGHGLIGMRERVELVDGAVTARPTPQGGYLVEALLPLQEVTRVDPRADR